MEGLVEAQIKSDRSSAPRLVGYIKSLSNKTVHVPLQHHEVLEAVVEEGARRTQGEPPRFEATIIGQWLEPWLVWRGWRGSRVSADRKLELTNNLWKCAAHKFLVNDQVGRGYK